MADSESSARPPERERVPLPTRASWLERLLMPWQIGGICVLIVALVGLGVPRVRRL